MPAKRLSMRKIREVLRLKWACGLSDRQIAKTRSMGRTAVGEYLRRARAAGLSWPLAEELDDAELEKRLFPAPPVIPAQERPQPSWIEVHKELRRLGVTLFLLWQEYREVHPQGYQYSRFCEIYRRFAKKLSPSMRQVHRAGEKAFVDFSGKRPTIVDPKTGEETPAELFVGVLGASGYVYAEATANQDLSSWIGVHTRMVEHWDGCPALFVPDNLKSGVTTACRYEPGINKTYEDFCRHYGAAVIPARPYCAKDKAKAEASVLLAQRWILAALRNRRFFSLGEINEAIRDRARVLNDRPMQKLGVSRRELFEQLDRPALKPLPPNRYEISQWKRCTVNIDYHVEVDHNYYSVPYQLIHEQVEARFSASTVEVLFKSNRVASHVRLYGKGRYSTKTEHMPRSHRAHAQWTPSRMIAWAEKVGGATARMVAGILESRPHPEHGYRSCLGIMRLGRAYGKQRLEAACDRACRLEAFSYRTVNNILKSGLDRVAPDEEPTPTRPVPAHDNIRGAAYYSTKETPC